jgi:protein SCO1/2
MADPAPRRQMTLPLVVLALSLVLLAGAVAVTMWGRGPGAPAPSAIGGPFTLTDQDGRKVTQDDFRGQPVLVFFGYTHCPDVCPTTLFEISEVMRKLGADAKVRGAFVTVDPERDTPDLLKSYLSSFDKRIGGLTGDRPAIDAMLRNYRVYSKKIPGEGEGYSMDHSAIVYLMDRQMRFINALPLQDEDRAVKEIQRWM